MRGFALLFVLATAQGTPFQHFFGKYAAVKMLASCFGNQYMTVWTKNFTDAVEFCNQLTPETYLADLPLDDYPVETGPDPQFLNDDFGADINEDNLANYLPPPGDYYANTNQPSVANIQALLAALQGNLTHPILLIPLTYPVLQGLAAQQQGQGQGGLGDLFFRQNRQKRQTPEEGDKLFDANTINKVYQKIRNKAGNFTCLMKKLRIFNDKFDVNIGFSLNQIKNLKLDPILTSDLFEAMTDCVRFASCKSLNKRSLMPAAVQRAMTYMQCENKQTLAACVKNDLMQQQDKFDKTALENIEAGSDVDIGDKMLALVWGKFTKEDYYK